MNKVTAITGGAIALIIIGGIIYFASNSGTPIPLTTNTVDQTGTIVAGQTDNSVPVSSRADAPIVVTNQTTIPTGTTVVFSGTVNPNGALTSYWYEYGGSSDLGKKSTTQTLGGGYANFNAPAYITDLNKNATYYFSLIAENQYGKVAGNQYSFTTTNGIVNPIGGLPVVRTLSATGISRNAVNLNSEITPNRVSTDYWFEYGKTNNLGNTTASASAGSGSVKISESSSLSNLEPMTTYYFRVNAQNQYGTVNGSIQSFKTLGPAASALPIVSTVSAINITASSSTLRANINSNGQVTNYWFEYSKNSFSNSPIISETSHVAINTNNNNTSVSSNISNLITKTTYYFRIVAESSTGTVRGTQMSFRTK